MKKSLLKNQFVTNLLLFSIFVLPMERIGSFDLGGFTVRASQILILLALLLYVFSRVVEKRLEIYFAKPYTFYFLFLVSCMLSLLYAQDQGRGVFILGFLLFMFFVSFAFSLILDKREKIKKAVDVFLYSSLLFSVFGIFQFIGDMLGLSNSITGLSERYISSVMGVTRIQSTFIEPLYFANFLLIPIFIVVFFILKEVDKKNNRRYLIMLLVFAVSLILTFSKGAIASLAIMVFVLFLFQVRSIFNRQNIVYLLITIIFTASLIFGVYSTLSTKPDIDRFYSRISDVMLGGSVTERRDAYSIAWEAFESRPVLGIGIGNFGPYFSGYPVSAPDFGWAIANNEYLEVLAETGIVGLLSFILFLASIVYFSARAYIQTKDTYFKALIIALCFAFMGILVQYMTFSTLYIMHIWFLIGLILAIQQIIFMKGNKKNVK